MQTRSSALHSVTWLLWAVGTTITLQLAPNPLYVATVFAVVVLVYETHRIPSPTSRAFGVLLVVASVFSLIRVALIVATTHTGGSTFATVPEVGLPRLLGGFPVGGGLEWAVLWTALAEAFVVIAVMATFGAFNSVASHHELLQVLPRAFHAPGLIVTVALAFVPSTITAVQQVRDADRARTGGRVVRRGRAIRLVIPVLESGLERAVALAESMDSRGFGRGRPTTAQRVSGWLSLGCLLSLAGAMVALIGRHGGLATVLALVGVASLVVAILLAPSGTATTRYRPRRLTRVDGWILAASACAPVAIGIWAATGDESLRWAAGQDLALPSFHVLPALCILLLATPALVKRPVEHAEAAAAAPVARARVATSS